MTAVGGPMGLLGGGFDYSKAAEEEFNDWYDTEHIPQRLCIPGFVNGVRWLGTGDSRISLALYDLEGLAVLDKPEYRAVSPENFSPWSQRILLRQCTRLCRFTCEQMGPGDRVAPEQARGLLVFATNVAPEVEDEFNAWYDSEHVPALAAVPGVLLARRFRSPGGGRHKYLATYHLSAPEVSASAAWKQAVATPWTKKMRAHLRDVLALTLRRYVRAT